MAVNIANAGKQAADAAVGLAKTYVIPMAIGVFVVAVIIGFVPAAKKFLA